MNRTTTIVVDDQDDIRFLIRHLIELADGGDLQVIAEAPDGETCLRILADFPPSDPEVVIIDWMMPGLNGIETAMKVREQRPGARIILCSAFGDSTLEKEAMDAGIDKFISKEHMADIPGAIRALTAA